MTSESVLAKYHYVFSVSMDSKQCWYMAVLGCSSGGAFEVLTADYSASLGDSSMFKAYTFTIADQEAELTFQDHLGETCESLTFKLADKEDPLPSNEGDISCHVVEHVKPCNDDTLSIDLRCFLASGTFTLPASDSWQIGCCYLHGQGGKCIVVLENHTSSPGSLHCIGMAKVG